MLWCACYARLRFIELLFGHVFMKWGTLCKRVFFSTGQKHQSQMSDVFSHSNQIVKMANWNMFPE